MKNVLPHYALFEAGIDQWLVRASPAQRDQLQHLTLQAQRASEALRLQLSGIPAVRDFALGLLAPRLPAGVDPEHATLVHRYQPGCAPDLGPLNPLTPLVAVVGDWVCPVETQRNTLLQAALANFPSPTGYGQPAETFQVQGADHLDGLAFVRIVHELNIGQRYQALLAERLPVPAAVPSVLQSAYEQWRQALLRNAACQARLSGQASEPALALLGEAQVPESTVQRSVALFGTVLPTLRVYAPASGRGPLLLHVPNAPEGALRSFADERTLIDHVLVCLTQPAGRRFLLRTALLKDQPVLARKLNGNVSEGAVTVAERDIVQLTPLADSSPRAAYAQWRAALLANAATLAVPRSVLAGKRHDLLIAKLVADAEQVLFTAAMLVPGCQPLGGAALAVYVHGIADQVYSGYHAWQLGDREEAINHLFSVATNLAAGVIVQRVHSRFFSQLLVLDGPDGAPRLWRHDTATWQAPQQPPAGVEPGADGLLRAGQRCWARVGTQLYPVTEAAQAGEAMVLRVPGNHEGVVPELVPFADGQWAWAHEHPLAWRGPRLLRAFGEVPGPVGDQALLEAQHLAGLTDDQLRYHCANRLPLPALLRYWLRHRELSHALQRWAGELRSLGWARVDAASVVGRLAGLAGWPRRLALHVEVNGGAITPFGAADAQAEVRLDAGDLASTRWATRVLAAMSDAEQRALVGELPPAERPRSLAERWAHEIEAHAPTLHRELLQGNRTDPRVQPLFRQFPGLTAEQALAIADSADQREVDALLSGRVPARLGGAAAQALRELRVSNALEALVHGRPGDDRDRLFMCNLGRLPDWPTTLGITLRTGSSLRPALAYVGAQAQQQRVIERRGAHYHLLAANATAGEGLTLSQAVYQALHARIVERAVGDWGQAFADLRLRGSARPAVQPLQRINAQVGYALSGRGRLLPEAPGQPLRARLGRLYPGLSFADLGSLLNTLRAQGDRSLAQWVAHLEAEWQALDLALHQWAYAPLADRPGDPSGLREAHAAMRRSVAQRLKAAWRREAGLSNSADARITLNLSYLSVENLPPLSASFSAVQSLNLDGTDLGSGLGRFLALFPNLLELTLKDHPITRLPAELASMSQLERLSLAGVELAASNDMFGPLVKGATPTAAAPPLKTLVLTGIRGIPAAALRALAGLPNLQSLRWDYAQGVGDAQLLAIAHMTRLRILNLTASGIRLTSQSQGFLGHLGHLTELSLAGNPLGLAPRLTGLRRLAVLDLSNTRLSVLPEGLADLLAPWPPVLGHIVLADNLIADVAPLIERLRGRELGENIFLQLHDNPLQGRQLSALGALGIFVSHRADQWLGSRPVLVQAARRARGNEAAAAFLDWLSTQVQLVPRSLLMYRTFLRGLLGAGDVYASERAAISDFDVRLEAFQRRIYTQVSDLVQPDAWSLSRQLDAFRAAQQIGIVNNDDPFDALLQHNYRYWQAELVDRYAQLPDAQEQLSAQSNRMCFVDWLLDAQNELDQIDVMERIGEQDWRPYLELVSPRWAQQRAYWDAAGELLLEDGATRPIDAGQLPADLVYHLIKPGDSLPRAFHGVGEPPDVIEPVADVPWRQGGMAQWVTLNEDQYRRSAVIYRRVRLMVLERVAREITEAVVGPWWEPVAQ
ncbi:leucine-rich repeat domain-containing protein [Pseudomonas typographi]|uniref:leucine-rich repeat domain-containing protein n=1 Tax=Pseudomonas typographi TaxID=2715964 RepID=UPI001686E3AA|nr:leucine-rich repeat domain-containing protein [Pseudomonas typographi]MBD1553914.1 leucine-rich repeat domain-containing protein [Pseudomonas typographi]